MPADAATEAGGSFTAPPPSYHTVDPLARRPRSVAGLFSALSGPPRTTCCSISPSESASNARGPRASHRASPRTSLRAPPRALARTPSRGYIAIRRGQVSIHTGSPASPRPGPSPRATPSRAGPPPGATPSRASPPSRASRSARGAGGRGPASVPAPAPSLSLFKPAPANRRVPQGPPAEEMKPAPEPESAPPQSPAVVYNAVESAVGIVLAIAIVAGLVTVVVLDRPRPWATNVKRAARSSIFTPFVLLFFLCADRKARAVLAQRPSTIREFTTPIVYVLLAYVLGCFITAQLWLKIPAWA